MTASFDSSFNRPLTLPCGAIVKNRVVKSAMSDSLGDGEGNATKAQARLYEKWAQGGVGLSIIGEVQIDYRYPETPGNLFLGSTSDIQALQLLTKQATTNGAHIWPQLGHAGSLSYSLLSTPKGPSPLSTDDFKCSGMSLEEVLNLPEQYANAAKIAKQAGFTGVQIHAGHGFLLSQFLSPLFNHRQDQYGGDLSSRCQVIIEIIDKVRKEVGKSFPIGIKINSSDQLKGGLTQEEALEAINILDKTSIDLIEISGGSYFPGATSSSDSASKGPYFIDFVKKARKYTSIPLVVTGGFKTRQEVNTALTNNGADMVGLARALVLLPNLVNNWNTESNITVDFPRFTSPPAGGITAWYTMCITAISNDHENSFNLDLHTAIQTYQERDKLRCVKWQEKFNSSK